MNFPVWTPFIYVYPPAFTNEAVANAMDGTLHEWSVMGYRWDQDDWGGLKDLAQPPMRTVRLGHGDCEDYALVAASYLKARGKSPVKIAFDLPPEGHVVAVGPERVYSSGSIFEGSLDDFEAKTKWNFRWVREVR